VVVSASELRQNIYRLLDGVIDSGVPLDIECKGKRLRIVPMESGSKLQRIPTDPALVKGDPADLFHIDWSEHWRP
jgi:hypothetical protein